MCIIALLHLYQKHLSTCVDKFVNKWCFLRFNKLHQLILQIFFANCRIEFDIFFLNDCLSHKHFPVAIVFPSHLVSWKTSLRERKTSTTANTLHESPSTCHISLVHGHFYSITVNYLAKENTFWLQWSTSKTFILTTYFICFSVLFDFFFCENAKFRNSKTCLLIGVKVFL